MQKKLVLALLVSVNLLAKEEAIQEKTPGTISSKLDVLHRIVEDVKDDWQKIDSEVETEFKKLYDSVRKMEEHYNHIKNSKKSLQMGTEVLNKANEYLMHPEVQSHPDVRRAQASIKVAQAEHKKAMSVVETSKSTLEKNNQQLEKHIDQLTKALDKVNEKSKIAIEKAQPVLQSLKPEAIQPVLSVKSIKTIETK